MTKLLRSQRTLATVTAHAPLPPPVTTPPPAATLSNADDHQGPGGTPSGCSTTSGSWIYTPHPHDARSSSNSRRRLNPEATPFCPTPEAGPSRPSETSPEGICFSLPSDSDEDEEDDLYWIPP